MTIYISHSKQLDFVNKLYIPLRKSVLNSQHQIILPHENSSQPFDAKTLFSSKNCALVIAEVSFPATGQGIELGWADCFNIPIICFYKAGSKISNSLHIISKKFSEYSDANDLMDKIISTINELPKN